MSVNDPRKPDEKQPSPPRAQPVDPNSLPLIDLGQEGMVDLGELSMDQDGSAIPLAELPEPPSGQSLTSWTEVIRRQRAAQVQFDAAEAVDVDAPSDKDLLVRVNTDQDLSGGSEVSKRTGDTSEIHPADLPVYTAPLARGSESDIDLGVTTPGVTGGSEIGFDILFPPSDAGGAMPLPSKASGVDLIVPDAKPPSAFPVDDDVIPMATSAGPGISGVSAISGIDFGADSGPISETGRSSILDVLLRETAGGQAFAPKTTMPLSNDHDRPSVPTQPGIDLTEERSPSYSDLDLSGPDSTFGSDDAVDFHTEAAHPPSITDSGTLEISEEAVAESQRRSEQLESSSIDLNSRPTLPESKFNLDVPTPGRGGSESDIDLSLPPIEDDADSSMIAKPGTLEENQEVLAAELEARRQRSPDKKASKPPKRRNEVVPSRDDEVPAAHRRGYLLHGGVLGLLLGAGGVLAAYFGGALPNRGEGAKPPADNSATVAQLRQEADASKKKETNAVAAADAIRKSLTDAGIDPDKVGSSVKQLADARTTSENRATALATEVQKAKDDLDAARLEVTKAKTAEDAAKKSLVETQKEVTDAKTKLADATKAVETATTDAAKAIQLAKTDATKAIETAKAETAVVKKAGDDAVKVAEAKEKDAVAKLVVATKRETELTKANETAKKSADDATKARDASDSLLKSITDRLVKAKFVAEKADSADLVKGLDTAIKAASTDSTVTLRDELTKVRESEAKSKAEAAIAKEKEIATQKQLTTVQTDLQKLNVETVKLKGDAEKFAKEASDAIAKAVAAEKIATQAKTNADQAAFEAAKLKTDNERLTRELATVRELAELIRSQAGTGTVTIKPDPAKLADRFFADGVRSFHVAQYTPAASAFRKAIQIRNDDARYHYLLGLSLWLSEDRDGAKAAFEKGRDLELEMRPSSRTISSEFERIQGPARHAMNAYRP